MIAWESSFVKSDQARVPVCVGKQWPGAAANRSGVAYGQTARNTSEGDEFGILFPRRYR